MKEEVRASIHGYFQEFGPELGEAIYQELRKPGGMPRILKRLGIPAEGDSSDHYRMLIQHFRRKGTSEFLELVGVKPLSFRIDVVSTPKNREDDTRKRLGLKALSREDNPIADVMKNPAPSGMVSPVSAIPPDQAKASAVRPSMPPGLKPLPPPAPIPPVPIAPIAASPPAKPPMPATPAEAKLPSPPAAKKTGPSPYDNVDEDGFPKGPLIPGASPDPSQLVPNAPSWDPNKPWDPTGTWPEVERRSGRERRHRPDRRLEVDVIYSNRRYGGDRREEQERRKNWPKGGHTK